MFLSREELLEKSVLNCKRCKEAIIPDNFGSPRVCAFDENGIFTTENWNCVTAGLLRMFAGESEDGHPNGESMYV